MTTLYSIDFSGEPDGPLDANWTQVYSGGALVVSGGLMVPNSAGAQLGAKVSGVSLPSAQWARGTIGGSDFTGTRFWAVMCCWAGVDGTNRGYRFSCNENSWFLTRVDANSGTNIASGSGAFVLGDVIEIQRTDANEIIGLLNGTPVPGASATDANYSDGVAAAETFQAGSVTAGISLFEAGDFNTPGGTVVNPFSGRGGAAAQPLA